MPGLLSALDALPLVQCIEGNATFCALFVQPKELHQAQLRGGINPGALQIVPTRIPVLVPVLLRQLMGTAKSRLECQSGQDRSGNIQVQGQFRMPSITLCKSLSRSSCGALYSPFPVSRDIPSSAPQQFQRPGHRTGWAVSGRDLGSGCASQPHVHPNIRPCLCRH